MARMVLMEENVSKRKTLYQALHHTWDEDHRRTESLKEYTVVRDLEDDRRVKVMSDLLGIEIPLDAVQRMDVASYPGSPLMVMTMELKFAVTFVDDSGDALE